MVRQAEVDVASTGFMQLEAPRGKSKIKLIAPNNSAAGAVRHKRMRGDPPSLGEDNLIGAGSINFEVNPDVYLHGDRLAVQRRGLEPVLPHCLHSLLIQPHSQVTHNLNTLGI